MQPADERDVESLEKAKRSGNAYIRINGTIGLPTPYELAGDERWSPGGEMFMKYDLELEDANDAGSWSAPVVEVDSGIDKDSAKIIDFSKMHQTPGVKALSENNAFENKNIGNNGGAPANYSEISLENIYDEFSGILSFN